MAVRYWKGRLLLPDAGRTTTSATALRREPESLRILMRRARSHPLENKGVTWMASLIDSDERWLMGAVGASRPGALWDVNSGWRLSEGRSQDAAVFFIDLVESVVYLEPHSRVSAGSPSAAFASLSKILNTTLSSGWPKAEWAVRIEPMKNQSDFLGTLASMDMVLGVKVTVHPPNSKEHDLLTAIVAATKGSGAVDVSVTAASEAGLDKESGLFEILRRLVPQSLADASAWGWRVHGGRTEKVQISTKKTVDFESSAAIEEPLDVKGAQQLLRVDDEDTTEV